MDLISNKLKKQHNDLVQRIKTLDALENPSEAQNTEAESRFTELGVLKKKIDRQLAIEAMDLPKPTDNIPGRELKKWSFSKVLKGLISGKIEGREKEISDELAKYNAFENRDAVLIPSDFVLGKPEDRVVTGQSALVSDPLKPELAQLALREASIMDKLKVTRVQATGSFNYPKNSNSTTSSFFTGDGGSDTNDSIAESDATFSSQSSEPHFLATLTGWTLSQIKKMAGNLSLENLLRRNMQMSMSEALNNKMLNGNSTTAAAEPDGLLKLLGTTNNTAKSLASSAVWSYTDFVNIIKEFRVTYKNNMASPVFLMDPTVESELKVIQKFSSSDGKSVAESIGPYLVTNHLTNLKVILGQWSEFIFVEYGAIALELGMIDSDFKKGIQRLRAILCCDFILDRAEGFRQFTITR